MQVVTATQILNMVKKKSPKSEFQTILHWENHSEVLDKSNIERDN